MYTIENRKKPETCYRNKLIYSVIEKRALLQVDGFSKTKSTSNRMV